MLVQNRSPDSPGQDTETQPFGDISQDADVYDTSGMTCDEV